MPGAVVTGSAQCSGAARTPSATWVELRTGQACARYVRTVGPVPPTAFPYSSLPSRPTGRGLLLLSRLVPGVRRTLADVAPFAAAWEEHNRRAAAADGPLWVVLGDSMAQGIGASAAGHSWAGRLAERLDPSYRMVNLSHHGARTGDALERQWAMARKLGPIDLVTVMVGSNDLFRRELRRDLPTRFRALLDALPADAAVANLPNPAREAREVDALLRDRARSGLVVADMTGSRTTSWRGKLAPDHFHPNDRGYAAIADVWFDALAGSGRTRPGGGHRPAPSPSTP